MTAIFAGTPGQVVSMGSDQAGKFFALSLAGAKGSYGQGFNKAVDFPGIVLSQQVSQSVSAQVMVSLADTVHASSFGDKPGSLGVSVLLNGSTCPGKGKATASDTAMATQVQAFNQFYRDYRLNSSSIAGDRAVLIVLGLESYRGYLMNATAKVESGAVPMAVGSLQFAVWFNSTI